MVSTALLACARSLSHTAASAKAAVCELLAFGCRNIAGTGVGVLSRCETTRGRAPQTAATYLAAGPARQQATWDVLQRGTGLGKYTQQCRQQAMVSLVGSGTTKSFEVANRASAAWLRLGRGTRAYQTQMQHHRHDSMDPQRVVYGLSALPSFYHRRCVLTLCFGQSVFQSTCAVQASCHDLDRNGAGLCQLILQLAHEWQSGCSRCQRGSLRPLATA